MKYFLTCLAYLHTVCAVWAQVTFRVNDYPANTPAQAELYISGNFENWSGGNPAYKLTKNQDNSYSITFPQQTGTLQFKFTRGSWASVEKGANGEEITNRTYTFGGNGATVDIKIHRWADFSSGGNPSTATSNVSILSNNFAMPQFNNRTRRIWLYLPPNYATSTASFPVIYMHDGQNLFDNNTAFSGEWQVDETLNALFTETGKAYIVVGIDNGGSERINEYTPWTNPTYGGGDGTKYMNFIVQTLKPYIDQQYRTLPDKQNTALIGSSLGGLISHFGALEHPTIFGKIGVFSPAFWFSSSVYNFSQNKGNVQDTKMYFLAGDSESQSMVPNLDNVMTTMQNAGFPSSNMTKKIVPNGTHSESLWRSNFKEAVQWLFAPMPLSIEDRLHLPFKCYPNPFIEELTLDAPNSETYELILLNIWGRQVAHFVGVGKQTYHLKDLPMGVYVCQIKYKKQVFVFRVLKSK